MLRRYSERAFLDIELKVEDLESKVLAALHEYPPQQGYVVSSFLPDVVMEMEARSASASIGIICENARAAIPLARAAGGFRYRSSLAGGRKTGATGSLGSVEDIHLDGE